MKRRAACLLLLVLAPACTFDADRETILPWLERRSFSYAFGAFPASTHTRHYTRRFGLWWKLDAWGVRALDAGHALAYGSEGIGILRRGSRAPNPACKPQGMLAVASTARAVDCVSAAGVGADGAPRIELVRTSFEGERIDRFELDAGGGGRIFDPPLRVFAYDAESRPHFLVMDREAAYDYRRRPTRCALLHRDASGEPRLAEGPAEMSHDDCMDAARWALALERPLRAAE